MLNQMTTQQQQIKQFVTNWLESHSVEDGLFKPDQNGNLFFNRGADTVNLKYYFEDLALELTEHLNDKK